MLQNKHNAYEQPTDYSAQSIVYKNSDSGVSYYTALLQATKVHELTKS